MSETVLWTNPSPTSNFVSQTVTLSQSIENFKQIALYFRYSKSNTKQTFYIYDKDEFKTFLNTSNSFAAAINCRISNSSYSRSIFYVDDTKITYGGLFQIAGTTENQAYAIPTKIVGLK